MTTGECMRRAWESGIVVPAFNIPHLPMMESVARAVRDEDAFSLVEVARLEFVKFAAGSPARIYDAYDAVRDPAHLRLHLDHVPVIDEDHERFDYLTMIREALDLGYESVMVDGSRLGLEENIAATRAAVDLAHAAGVPCEAELGSVIGHEKGPPPSYEEVFRTRRGFTDPAEAARFVRSSGCDWLSVAAGSIHGAVSGVFKDRKKPEARLDLALLRELRSACGVPLVLHGGSGVRNQDLLDAVPAGIAKVNVGTEIRQVYEAKLAASSDVAEAQEAVYRRTGELLRDIFRVSGLASRVTGNRAA